MSGTFSLIVLGLLAFFILFSLTPVRAPRADDTRVLSAFGMAHDEKATAVRDAEQLATSLFRECSGSIAVIPR
jgi:hypothetical protein